MKIISHYQRRFKTISKNPFQVSTLTMILGQIHVLHDALWNCDVAPSSSNVSVPFTSMWPPSPPWQITNWNPRTTRDRFYTTIQPRKDTRCNFSTLWRERTNFDKVALASRIPVLRWKGVPFRGWNLAYQFPLLTTNWACLTSIVLFDLTALCFLNFHVLCSRQY